MKTKETELEARLSRCRKRVKQQQQQHYRQQAMSASSYRRVPQRDSDHEDAAPPLNSSDSNNNSTSTRSRGERLEDKCMALGWVIVAILLAKWTDFFGVLWKNETLNRSLLKISLGGYLVATLLFLYLTVYLPRVKGLSDPSVWGVYCPKVFPAMCGIGVLAYLVLVRALWPLWGFLAPVITGTELMGMLMALHFVPTFGLC